MDLMGYCFDGGLLCGNVAVDKGFVVAFLIISRVFSVSLLSLISISLLFLNGNLYSLIFIVSWVRACALEDAFLSKLLFWHFWLLFWGTISKYKKLQFV